MTRSQYLQLSLFSLFLLIFALILQQFGYQGVSFLPCPLCILQRVGYIGITFFCLLAACFPQFRRWFHGLAILAAGYGLVIAGRQVWLLSHPESSCGIDPLETWINQFGLVQGLPWLFKADGLCSLSCWPLPGKSRLKTYNSRFISKSSDGMKRESFTKGGPFRKILY
jgi:protein dithiol:quinone oxidoreductase